MYVKQTDSHPSQNVLQYQCCVAAALCKAVCKADRHSEPMLVGIFPIGPDRKGVLFYQAFYIWRGFSIVKMQEMAAGFVRSGRRGRDREGHYP